MKPILLLISFVILAPSTFAQVSNQKGSLELPSPKKKKQIKSPKNLKQKIIKNKAKVPIKKAKVPIKKAKVPIKKAKVPIKKEGKKSIIKSEPYRKLSSRKIQKKLNKHINLMADSCNSKYKTQHERLNLFKNNIVKLRAYLRIVIKSDSIKLDQQMESKSIYNQIKEKNFPALGIIKEKSPVKEKVDILEASFKSFYMHYYQRKNNSKYEDWAKTLLTGINCIND